jgi:uncharacterized protein YlxW (UPF0749 family)
VALVTFALGLLLVVQFRSQTGGTGLAVMSAQDLTVLVANLNTHNDQLRAEVSNLDQQLAALKRGRSSGATSVNQIQADLSRIRAWSGLDPVGGQGITITIAGPISGPSLEDVINELRNAGAEAIAIENVRVVPGTVLGGAAGRVSVNTTTLADPFTILAIGKPTVLTGSLARAGGIIAQLAATNPTTTVDVSETQHLELPATTRNLVPSHGHPRL